MLFPIRNDYYDNKNGLVYIDKERCESLKCSTSCNDNNFSILKDSFDDIF
jgi:hypothetical protein